jgi:hypothetical protein
MHKFSAFHNCPSTVRVEIIFIDFRLEKSKTVRSKSMGRANHQYPDRRPRISNDLAPLVWLLGGVNSLAEPLEPESRDKQVGHQY